MNDEELLCDIVPISAQRYQELLRAEHKLAALEAGSVDNWDGYDSALKEYMRGLVE